MNVLAAVLKKNPVTPSGIYQSCTTVLSLKLLLEILVQFAITTV